MRVLSFAEIADFGLVVVGIGAGGVFTLAVVLDRHRAARGIGRRFAARLYQIGWIVDHGGKIALACAAEIPVGTVLGVSGIQTCAEIVRPKAAWAGRGDDFGVVDLDA